MTTHDNDVRSCDLERMANKALDKIAVLDGELCAMRQATERRLASAERNLADHERAIGDRHGKVSIAAALDGIEQMTIDLLHRRDRRLAALEARLAELPTIVECIRNREREAAEPEFDEITGCRQVSRDENVPRRLNAATESDVIAEKVLGALRDPAVAYRPINRVVLREPRFRVGDRVVSEAGIAGTVREVSDERHYVIEYDTAQGFYRRVPERYLAGLAREESE
jgi:threonine synthase